MSKKPDFGRELDDLNNDPDQPFIEIGKYFRDKNRGAKDLLIKNNRHTAVVLSSDLNSEVDDKNKFYHVYLLSDVHANKANPLDILDTDIKGLSSSDLTKLYQKTILANFNDDESYVFNASDSALGQGDLVEIVYDNVVDGELSGGRIVSISTILTPLAQGTVAYAQKVDLKKVANETIRRTRKRSENFKNTTKCEKKALINFPDADRYIFNYSGKIRHFDYNCCKDEINKAARDMQKSIKIITNASLWSKTSFQSEIETIINQAFGNQYYPYLFGGVREYTSPTVYRWKKNRDKIRKASINGKDYFTAYQDKLDDTKRLFKDGAFDCSGVVAYLAFELGFIVGLRNNPKPVTPSNYNKNSWKYGRGSNAQAHLAKDFGLEITIDQFAHTPGACAFYKRGNVYGHVLISLGKGYRKNKDGSYIIKTVEAMNFSYHTKLREATFKDVKGDRKTAKHRKEEVFFGIPITFALAQRFYKDVQTSQQVFRSGRTLL
jgi:cell wall-associated NlpC family hydrolase